MSPPLKLSDLVDRGGSPTKWFQHHTGFSVQLRYLPKSEFQTMSRECTETRFNKKTHLREEEINAEKLTKLFTKTTVVSWKDLTVGRLRQLVPVKADAAITDDTDIPFDLDAAMELVTSAYDFERWVRDICLDISEFQSSEFGAELKNL